MTLSYQVIEYKSWSMTKPDEHILYSLADIDD